MILGEAKLEIQNLRCSLGEGPHWDTERDNLCFVDILSQKIYAYNPFSFELKSKDVDSPPGCIIPTDDVHKSIVCTQKGIQVISFDEPNTVLLLDRNIMEPGKEFNRFNVGKVDSAGRLWVGTMASNGKEKQGTIFCSPSFGKFTPELVNIGISNGIAWSNNSQTMYYIDSSMKAVYSYEFDNIAGKPKPEPPGKTVFTLLNDGECMPCGMTIDSEDFLWIAIWGGQRVIRVNPATGKEVARIRVPAKNVTSCCFGGPDLTTLYITTASHETNTSSFPLAGGVFSFETNIMGNLMNRYSLGNLELSCLERAEQSVTRILKVSSNVAVTLSEIGPPYPDRPDDDTFTTYVNSVKNGTQEILQLCQSIKQDMRVPLHGLTENFRFTNTMSIYGPRKDMEIAHRRSLLIYESLLAMKCNNSNNNSLQNNNNNNNNNNKNNNNNNNNWQNNNDNMDEEM
jgi:sugar lactone lactonase YvrE